MSERNFLIPNAAIDTEALEEEIRRTIATGRAHGQVGEALIDLVYSGRIEYGGPDDSPMGLQTHIQALLRMAPLQTQFKPISVHRGVGPLVEKVKAFAIWAVRGLVSDLADQQQAINQTQAAVLERVVMALQEKVDRRAPVDAYGFDRAMFYQLLSYPEPFPTRTAASLVPSGAQVWELGAGIGDLLAELPHASALGVEASVSCLNVLERRGLSVVHEDLLDFLVGQTGRSVDVAVLSRVVDELDPGTLCRVLALIRERLSKGGFLLLLSGPRSFMERDVLATRFYPHATLAALLITLGYSVETQILNSDRTSPLAGTEPETWYALIARTAHE